jgi:hypothetical protein
MNTYRINYTGNTSYLKQIFKDPVNREFGNTEREAVEKYYARMLDHDYFPQRDGSIHDMDGNTIASPTDTRIDHDGGCFSATLIFARKSNYEIHEFANGYYGIGFKDGPTGAGIIFGGDSADSDNYDRDLMELVLEKWDGSLNEDGRIEI